MRLSEDKVRHLAHLVYDTLIATGAEATHDDARARRELKGVITRWLKAEDEIEESVRKTIRSYSRNVVEGSPEWEVLFQKHYKEELSKRGKLG